MNVRLYWASLRSDQNGAATVDWVVLTAATAFLCLAAISQFINEDHYIGDTTVEDLDTLGEHVENNTFLD